MTGSCREPSRGPAQLQCWLLLCLQLLLAVTAAAQQQQYASCTLEIEGFYTKSGLRSIKLACTGGTILAAAAPEFRQLVPSAPGVIWAPDAHCSSEAFNCLFRVCKPSNVHFKMIRIVGLQTPEYVASMCLVRDTDVIISNATFKDNTAGFLGATNGKVRVKAACC